MIDTPQRARPPREARDLKVDPEKCPGWVNGATRLPAAGERVYTNEGPAVVVRVVGRTSDGHLLELTMDDGRKPAFFADTRNVMLEPDQPRADPKDEEVPA